MEQIVDFDEHGDGVITGDLVRCGECKHRELVGGSHVCRQLGMLSVDPDWFCADGEREVQE